MAKSGSFKPGRSGPSSPGMSKGRNGPNDKGGGTTHRAHPNTGTNRAPSTGDSAGHTQWKPGGEAC